jgi:hypothetical protein
VVKFFPLTALRSLSFSAGSKTPQKVFPQYLFLFGRVEIVCVHEEVMQVKFVHRGDLSYSRTKQMSKNDSEKKSMDNETGQCS